MGIFDFFQIKRHAGEQGERKLIRLFFGNTTSGKRVNERSAMQMAAVYSCVRILSEAVASLPLHHLVEEIRRKTNNSGKLYP